MYIKFLDKGFGESVEKFVFIEEELLNDLSCNFIYCFKQLLKREGIENFKELKRKPKGIERELDFSAWVGKTNYKLLDCLGYNYTDEYKKDIEKIEFFYSEEQVEFRIYDKAQKEYYKNFYNPCGVFTDRD